MPASLGITQLEGNSGLQAWAQNPAHGWDMLTQQGPGTEQALRAGLLSQLDSRGHGPALAGTQPLKHLKARTPTGPRLDKHSLSVNTQL